MKQAILSPCERFRYSLTRSWDETMPRLFFVMLNPSTADGTADDPTIRKCIGFATRNGFGSIQVFNLFAFRATHPEDLKAEGYPVGEDNDTGMVKAIGDWIEHEAWPGATKIVCAWGAAARDPAIGERAKLVSTILRRCGWKLHALEFTADGIPRHPLMLGYHLPFKAYAEDVQ